MTDKINGQTTEPQHQQKGKMREKGRETKATTLQKEEKRKGKRGRKGFVRGWTTQDKCEK